MVNLRTFDLNLLRIFEAIIQDRSVSKAADRLGLSQPAVSSALNRLREQFGDPLFVRTQQGMEPTPRALALAESVLDGLITIRTGLSAADAFDPSLSHRRFTLLMTDTGETVLLPAVLAKLRREAPHVRLAVVEFGLERYNELLEGGLADLALGHIRLPDSFCDEVIHVSSFAVLASLDNPCLRRDGRGRTSISFDNYMDAPHIAVRPRGASGDPVTEALGSQSSRRRIVLQAPHATALPSIIGDTDLIATVSKACADQMLAAGAKLSVCDMPFDLEPMEVRQCWHKRNTKDAGHRWLRRLFAEAGREASRAPRPAIA